MSSTIQIELGGDIDASHKDVLISALHDLLEQLDAADLEDGEVVTKDQDFPTLGMSSVATIVLISDGA